MKCDTVAIVVTYNRINMLKENIKSLLEQTHPIDILIIDNASTDGTREVIQRLNEAHIIYENTGTNLGGAGGFSYGIKKATELGYKYGWIMDDDSIPSTTALERMYDAVDLGNDFSFLASAVYWVDGRIFPMNRPTIERVMDEHVTMIKEIKAMPIESCSFVGCFLKLEYVWKIGLPIEEFFIYGDDLEYTRRLRKEAPGYWIFDSEIIHKAPSIIGADVVTADENRISRFYYQARNGVYLSRKQGGIKPYLKMQKKFWGRIFNIIAHSDNHKLLRIKVMFKGLLSGIIFNPKIKYPKDKFNDGVNI